ncbi:MAG: hypothetical protein QM501_08790 [Gimesia sp.]
MTLSPVRHDRDQSLDTVTNCKLAPDQPREKTNRDHFVIGIVGPKDENNQGDEVRHPGGLDTKLCRPLFDGSIAFVYHHCLPASPDKPYAAP